LFNQFNNAGEDIPITPINVALTDYHVLGIMHPADDNALNTDEKIWDLTMTINLKGVWWGSKYAILAMRQNPTDGAKGLHAGGSIINTASFVALMGAATPQLACES
jgi:NAD(P)-dependent dehydrogenase (short-subunit alcohol dehydrogenase family)